MKFTSWIKSASRSATGQSALTENQFQAIGPGTVVAMFSGATFVYNIAKDTYIALKPEEPIACTVETSERRNDAHIIEATIYNHGRHTVYIERLYPHDPENLDFDTYDINTSNFNKTSSDTDSPKQIALPYKLSAGQKFKFKLVVKNFENVRKPKEPFAKVAIVYVVAGLCKPSANFILQFVLRKSTSMRS